MTEEFHELYGTAFDDEKISKISNMANLMRDNTNEILYLGTKTVQ